MFIHEEAAAMEAAAASNTRRLDGYLDLEKMQHSTTIWRFVALIDPDKQIERDKSFCPQHSSPRKNYKNNSDASDQQHCKRVTLLQKSIFLSKNMNF